MEKYYSIDRRCSNYIWVINNFIAYLGATYIRGFTVVIKDYSSKTHWHYFRTLDMPYLSEQACSLREMYLASPGENLNTIDQCAVRQVIPRLHVIGQTIDEVFRKGYPGILSVSVLWKTCHWRNLCVLCRKKVGGVVRECNQQFLLPLLYLLRHSFLLWYELHNTFQYHLIVMTRNGFHNVK